MRTFSPEASSARVRFDPINPAPPVTRYFIPPTFHPRTGTFLEVQQNWDSLAQMNMPFRPSNPKSVPLLGDF
jgi:hypothetical protein